MSYTMQGNENYAAYTLQVEERHLVKLDGLDNLLGLVVFGQMALVPNTTKTGDVLVVFPSETQLNHDFLSKNNLYRDATLNVDKSEQGYVEKNRRVKSLKLRGHISTSLALNVAALSVLAKELPEPGTYFDHYKDVQISKKYVIREPKPNTIQVPKKQWVSAKQFPEHFDTANLLRNIEKLDSNKPIWITQKLHGTSVRYGNVLVERELSWRERLAQRLGLKVQTHEYRFVVGSRKVVKTDPTKSANHYYANDIWSWYGTNVVDLIPQGYMVYGELVGWANETTPIQKNYTYEQPEGVAHLYVYRVSQVNAQGIEVDLSFEQVQEFCRQRGLSTVPVLNWFPEPFLDENDYTRYLDINYYNTFEVIEGNPIEQAPVRLSGTDFVDEGICVRQDGLTPLVLKLKSPKFVLHETAVLDSGQADLEETQNV